MRRVMDFFMYVFSAHAEVVPALNGRGKTLLSILRARGGSSLSIRVPHRRLEYSPRTRR